jgi:hypothetical protein
MSAPASDCNRRVLLTPAGTAEGSHLGPALGVAPLRRDEDANVENKASIYRRVDLPPVTPSSKSGRKGSDRCQHEQHEKTPATANRSRMSLGSEDR